MRSHCGNLCGFFGSLGGLEFSDGVRDAERQPSAGDELVWDGFSKKLISNLFPAIIKAQVTTDNTRMKHPAFRCMAQDCCKIQEYSVHDQVKTAPVQHPANDRLHAHGNLPL